MVLALGAVELLLLGYAFVGYSGFAVVIFSLLTAIKRVLLPRTVIDISTGRMLVTGLNPGWWKLVKLWKSVDIPLGDVTDIRIGRIREKGFFGADVPPLGAISKGARTQEFLWIRYNSSGETREIYYPDIRSISNWMQLIGAMRRMFGDRVTVFGGLATEGESARGAASFGDAGSKVSEKPLHSRAKMTNVMVWIAAVAVFGFGSFISVWHTINRKFVATRATVTNVRPSNHLSFEYAYTVGGAQFFGQGTAGRADLQFERMRPGDVVAIYYDTNQPAVSTVEPTEVVRARAIGCGIAVCAVIPLLLMILLHRFAVLPRWSLFDVVRPRE